jgi:hypothetical protein
MPLLSQRGLRGRNANWNALLDFWAATLGTAAFAQRCLHLQRLGAAVHAITIISVLAFVFIIIPILYWGIRLAWWLTRVAFISLLILIYLANRAWRREMD